MIRGNRHRAVHGLVKEWEGPGPGEGEGEERLPVETTVVHMEQFVINCVHIMDQKLIFHLILYWMYVILKSNAAV